MLRPPTARTHRAAWYSPAAALALAALALTACQDVPSPVAPPMEAVVATGLAGTQGRIAYSSLRNSRYGLDIYVLDVAKGSSRRLTRNRGTDDAPAWSPNGQRIAYENSSPFGAGRHIYVMSATGDGARAITNTADHGSDNTHPSWSPDGTRLLFSSSTPGGSGADILIIPADGSGPAVNLTNEPTAYNLEPVWAPNAAGAVKFAFTSARGGSGLQVWVYDDSKTPALTQVTMGGGRMPAWSPDGTKLAYAVQDNNGFFDVFVVSADGTGSPTNLTNTATAHDTYPHWSSDGSKLAFASSRDGNSEIYLVNADGTASRRLTVNTVPDLRPAWQP